MMLFGAIFTIMGGIGLLLKDNDAPIFALKGMTILGIVILVLSLALHLILS